MIWGLTLFTGKLFSQTVKRPFHLSMAALEIDLNGPVTGNHVQVVVKTRNEVHLLCTLGPKACMQQPLNLYFSKGEEISFCLYGEQEACVHLSGFQMEEEMAFADDYHEDEYDTEEPSDASDEDNDKENEEDEDWKPEEVSVGAKRKTSPVKGSKNKKMKIVKIDEDEGEEDDSEYESSFIDDETMEEEEEEESEDGGDEADYEFFKDALALLSAARSPGSSQTPPAQKMITQGTASENSPKKKKQKDKSPKDNSSAKQQSKELVAVGADGDATNGDVTAKKKKKKKKNNNKPEENESKEQSTAVKPTESPTPAHSPAVGKKRTVAGGTGVEDSKIGHGPEAKPGKMVSVYYTGTLAKSNKRFDSCLKGKPFRFRLGQGEVIKGWDTGVIGMKVGGKRKIMVPPSQGYGNTRQGPIPPGSTLIFEVELKAVS